MNLIIGASSGLGKCLSDEFSKKNKTLLVSRKKIANKSKNSSSLSLDITKNNNKKLLNKIKKNSLDNIFFTLGKVDWKKDNINIKNNLANSILNTNFFSITRLTYDLIKEKKLKKNCLICFCSSVTTIMPRHRQIIYCASKSALNSYARSLRFYFMVNNLPYRVLNIQLGYLKTKMSKLVTTPFEKIDPGLLSKYIYLNRKKLNTNLIFPKYWYLIKIIITLIPEKILIYFFKLFFSKKKYF